MSSYTALVATVSALRNCRTALHDAQAAAGPNVGYAIRRARDAVERILDPLAADLAEIERERGIKPSEDESRAAEHEWEMRRIGRTPEGTGRA